MDIVSSETGNELFALVIFVFMLDTLNITYLTLLLHLLAHI